MTEPRQIDVRDQAKLSYAKIFELVRSGIMHRLLRSTLTMSVILLAVAFFMFSLTESSIVNSVDQGVQEEIAVQRSTPLLLTHLSATPNPLQMAQRVARSADQPDRLAELAAVTGLDGEEVAELAGLAAREMAYLRFFESMSPGKRIALVDKAKGRAILHRLRDDTHWTAFSEQFGNMPELRLPSDLDQLRDFVEDYPDYLERMAALTGEWNEQVRQLAAEVAELTGDQELRVWLAQADDQAFAQWIGLVRAHGFAPTDRQIDKIRPDLRLTLRLQDIQQTLKTPEKRNQWLSLFRTRADMEGMLAELTDPRMVDELLEGAYTVEELEAVQEMRRYEQLLADLETGLTAVVGKDHDGGILSNRQVFLLAISFVVCMVGIANAMLMAITERFREIATMKCLGATDRFILVQFMMEAGLQGVAGGVLGMLIGFVLTFIKMLVLYGAYPLYYFPAGTIAVCALFSLLTGILLAVFASIYPSYSASRMAPMEAMRVE
ncbi:MAG: ABC transporter permease [Planctomycetota bacterium]